MILRIVLEGLVLGALLVLLCVVGFLAIYGIELLARIIVKKEEK